MSALRGVRVGDIVKCDVRGREFFAEVQGASALVGTDLVVKPITKGISWRHVSARQVTDVYVKRRPRRRPPPGKIERPAAPKG